jgi:exonuclease VII small subunit
MDSEMNKTTTCHCGEDGYYSCAELREKLKVARKQLEEAISAFEEHIHAVDYARRSYHNSTLWYYDGLDDRIDAAEQRLWNIKEQLNNEKS